MIKFSQTLKDEFGYVDVSVGADRDANGKAVLDVEGRPRPNPKRDTHCKTLLSLMHWTSYTLEGRKFVFANKEDTPQSSAAIRAKCAEYGIVDNRLVEAILNAHIWALKWEVENMKGAGGNLAMKAYSETIYNDSLAYIMSQLTEDFKGPEFTINW